MKTTQADYKTDIAMLGKQLAERDTANTRWIVGTIAVAAVLIVAILGFLIRSADSAPAPADGIPAQMQEGPKAAQPATPPEPAK